MISSNREVEVAQCARSTHRTRGWRMASTILPLVVILATTCAPKSHLDDDPAAGAPLALAEVDPSGSPLTELQFGVEDDVDALDLAAGPSGTLHLVVRTIERRSLADSPSYETRYLLSTDDGHSWAAPLALPSLGGQPARVALGSDGTLYVIGGPRLTGAVRRAGSDRFETLDPLIRDGGRRAISLELAVADGEVLALYLARERASSELSLWVQGTSESSGRPSRIAGFPASDLDLPAPRLLQDGSRWWLAVAVNVAVHQQRQDRGRTSEETSTRAEISIFASDDRGSTWHREPGLLTDELSQIEDLELFLHGGRPWLVFSSFGLHAAPLGGSARVNAARLGGMPGPSNGALRTGALSTATARGQTWLAWIDDRYRRSDRRPWKPLGGWPWGDSPDWINNDLFLLRSEALARALAGQPSPPERLTPDGSFTQSARLRAGNGRIFLARTGRLRAAKSRGDRGEPPGIWVSPVLE